MTTNQSLNNQIREAAGTVPTATAPATNPTSTFHFEDTTVLPTLMFNPSFLAVRPRSVAYIA